MPKLIELSNNFYRKQPTEADFLRPTGILADNIVIINSTHVATRIVPTGFRYSIGDNQLEVYLNGQFIRVTEWVNGHLYGEYEEFTNYSVRFVSSYLHIGDIVRFRVTSANYTSVFSGTGTGGAGKDIEDLQNNLTQLGKEVFGDDYSFSYTGNPTTRTIGIIPNNVTTPDISGYRTWKTATGGSSVEISNLTQCRADDVKYIIFSNGLTTIKSNANINLQGGLDFTGSYGDTIQLIFDGLVWYELSRSLNS